mmetsp:Transcript_10871/g.32311  ORF Transcript_10871/g.32311 Transcript_10871/m.32311 type:complete len:279 (-) Transcript_10871:798-1634(-)
MSGWMLVAGWGGDHAGARADARVTTGAGDGGDALAARAGGSSVGGATAAGGGLLLASASNEAAIAAAVAAAAAAAVGASSGLSPLGLELCVATAAAAAAPCSYSVRSGLSSIDAVRKTLSRDSRQWSIVSAGFSTTLPTGLAGDPPTMVCGSTGLSTRLPAAICAPSPTTMLPRMVALAPMSTFFAILGCRSPMSLPVPPSVTFCSSEQLSPITAVSPMTTPVPWSSRMPLPMRAAGWISTAKTSLMRLCSAIASTRWPRCHSACAMRCDWMAWYPLK